MFSKKSKMIMMTYLMHSFLEIRSSVSHIFLEFGHWTSLTLIAFTSALFVILKFHDFFLFYLFFTKFDFDLKLWQKYFDYLINQ